MRSALRDWLAASLPLLSVREARSVEEALKAAELAKLDLALVNIELPGPNGLEAARELRKRYSELPLIVMSIHESEMLRIAALEAGADAFICKRELMLGLPALVQRLLSRN